jgi:hypothetical protein
MTVEKIFGTVVGEVSIIFSLSLSAGVAIIKENIGWFFIISPISFMLCVIILFAAGKYLSFEED